MIKMSKLVLVLFIVSKTTLISVISADENCTAFTNHYQDRIASTSIPSTPQYGSYILISGFDVCSRV